MLLRGRGHVVYGGYYRQVGQERRGEGVRGGVGVWRGRMVSCATWLPLVCG